MAQDKPQSFDFSPEEIEHIRSRREAADAERVAREQAEAERVAREKSEAEARAKAESAATGAAKARVRSDGEDIKRLIDAVGQCLSAVRSIRSHIPSDGDATPSAGRLLQAILRRGGSINEYHSDGQIWALKHAIGGESSSVEPIDKATVLIVTTLIEGMMEPRSVGERERRLNVRKQLEEYANIFAQSRTRGEALAGIERYTRDAASARAQQEKIDHDRRLAHVAKRNPAYLPAAGAAPVATSVEGEYIPEDSADAPGAGLPVG